MVKLTHPHECERSEPGEPGCNRHLPSDFSSITRAILEPTPSSAPIQEELLPRERTMRPRLLSSLIERFRAHANGVPVFSLRLRGQDLTSLTGLTDMEAADRYSDRTARDIAARTAA